jgi:DNA-binding XRE family transcriptional regulator
MGMIVTEYTHVFDGVQFAIDVKAAREKRMLSQKTVASALGFETGAAVGMIERAEYDKSMKMQTFLHLCQLFDLHPFEYFDLQRASTIDLFKMLG